MWVFLWKIRVVLVYLYESSMPGLKEKYLILISAAGSSLWWNVMKYMEKAMAPHSSTLAWKIPWTEEPGRLQSMGFRRVGHDWATSLSLFTFMDWRRKWQPTPVFLPGESQGRGSLVACRCTWGCMGLHRVGHDWSNLAAAAYEEKLGSHRWCCWKREEYFNSFSDGWR